LHLAVGADNGERHLGHDFVVLSDSLVVVELVARALKDADAVVLDVVEDLGTLEKEERGRED
jgi:hypothetical protein